MSWTNRQYQPLYPPFLYTIYPTIVFNVNFCLMSIVFFWFNFTFCLISCLFSCLYQPVLSSLTPGKPRESGILFSERVETATQFFCVINDFVMFIFYFLNFFFLPYFNQRRFNFRNSKKENPLFPSSFLLISCSRATLFLPVPTTNATQ